MLAPYIIRILQQDSNCSRFRCGTPALFHGGGSAVADCLDIYDSVGDRLYLEWGFKIAATLQWRGGDLHFVPSLELRI